MFLEIFFFGVVIVVWEQSNASLPFSLGDIITTEVIELA